MNDSPNKLILASTSPRRRSLLAEAGYRFDVVSPAIDEPDEQRDGLTPKQLVESLAYFKARAVADKVPASVVLGADTVVAGRSGVLGKPADADDARRMLKDLSGTRHAVITGVAMLNSAGRRLIHSDVTWVTMRSITDEEIEQYVASGEWSGKAGGYAIQETADRFVDRLEGSFSNVVGLPVELVGQMIQRIGAEPVEEGT